eukprot:2317290-Rhodomonas_salina.1
MKKVKGVPDPLPVITSLSLQVDFPHQLYLCNPEKKAQVKSMAAAMIGKKRECAMTMAVLPGLIMSLYVAIGSTVCIHTCEMYENLKERLQPGDDPSDKRTWK